MVGEVLIEHSLLAVTFLYFLSLKLCGIEFLVRLVYIVSFAYR